MTYPRRANMYEHKCRNGHRRTEENTYIRPGGARQCKDCPGWQRSQMSTQQRAGGGRRAPKLREQTHHHYHRVLSAAELDYLRSLIPCAMCSTPFGAAHDGTCRVPYNREDDGTAESSTPRKRAA